MEQPILLNTSRPIISSYENPEIIDLPFVDDVGMGEKQNRKFWNVQPNGDYGDECIIGKAHAFEYLQYSMMTNANHMTWIVKDMPRNLTGIEVGFLEIIGEYARTGARLQAQRNS